MKIYSSFFKIYFNIFSCLNYPSLAFHHYDLHPALKGRGHTVFGGNHIGVAVTLFCVQDYLMNSRRIGTKFAWMLHLSLMKDRLAFSDLALIFKVTADLNMSNLNQIEVVCHIYGRSRRGGFL